MKYFPIMGHQYKAEDYLPLDLHVDSSSLYKHGSVTQDAIKSYLDTVRNRKNQILYGGYLEHRGIYTSQHFKGELRDRHLGVDLWTDAESPIYAPCNIKLHDMAYNGEELDYGYTLIYYVPDMDLYMLLGHLSKSSLEGKVIGQYAEYSEKIAFLGNQNENGGWSPHLHLQMIKDIGDYKGDYPGVCTASEVDYYRENCPDPIKLLEGVVPG